MNKTKFVTGVVVDTVKDTKVECVSVCVDVTLANMVLTLSGGRNTFEHYCKWPHQCQCLSEYN